MEEVPNIRLIKNDKVKINKRKKKIFKRGIALITTGLVLTGTAIVHFNHFGKKNTPINREAIVSYYGQESEEATVLRYLDVAVKLDELKLDEYNSGTAFNDTMYSKNELSTPVYIDCKTEEFKKISNFNRKELDECYSFLTDVIFLKQQEKLIDEYIEKEGYNIVYNNLTSSLKEYTAEEYNLPNPYSITFNYHFEKATGEVTIILNYSEGLNNYKCVVGNKTICDGVCCMVDIQDTKTANISNEEKLEKYVSALLAAKNYKIEVDEKDLYSKNSEVALKRM